MLPLGARDFRPLRKMPGLKRVSFWWSYFLQGPTLSKDSFWAIDPKSYVRMLEELMHTESGWENNQDVLDYFIELGENSVGNPELAGTLVQAGVILASAPDETKYETLRKKVLKRLQEANGPKGEEMESLARVALMKPINEDEANKILVQLEDTLPDRGFSGFTLALAAFRAGNDTRAKEILSDFRSGMINRAGMLASVLRAVSMSRLNPDEAADHLAGAAEEVSVFARRGWDGVRKYDWQDLFLARLLLKQAEDELESDRHLPDPADL